MNPATWKTIKETFSAALELPISERSDFLSNSDEIIRHEVERLLATYKEAQTFISTPLIVEKGLREKESEQLVGRQIDDYVILKKIGEGGMGTVLLAENCGQGFSQRVALKLIKRGMDTNAVLGRFLMNGRSSPVLTIRTLRVYTVAVRPPTVCPTWSWSMS